MLERLCIVQRLLRPEINGCGLSRLAAQNEEADMMKAVQAEKGDKETSNHFVNMNEEINRRIVPTLHSRYTAMGLA